MKINVIHVTESEYLLLELGNLHLNNYLISNRAHIVTNGKELQLEKVENKILQILYPLSSQKNKYFEEFT